MKRLFYMLPFLLLITKTDVLGQNVGIGVVDPTRARLEVHGAPGVGTTSGIFGGDGAGISLQKDWPTIGFNQYRAIPTGNGYALRTGYGMHMTFNYTNGDFAFLRNGLANAGSPLPLQQSFLSFIHATNSLRLNTDISGGRVDVANRLYAPQSGNFNMVPLGVIYVSLTYPSSTFTVTAFNQAGSLLFDYSTEGVGNTQRAYLYLTQSLIASYPTLVVVPAMTYGNPNGGEIQDLICRIENNGSRYIHIGVRVSSLGSQAFAQGSLIIYGIN